MPAQGRPSGRKLVSTSLFRRRHIKAGGDGPAAQGRRTGSSRRQSGPLRADRAERFGQVQRNKLEKYYSYTEGSVQSLPPQYQGSSVRHKTDQQ